jgi:hypothetical protein
VALADVTIKVKVLYRDRTAGSWKPARHVRLEAEGNWWGFDPQIETDDNGDYIANYRDPILGTYDINAEVYALTPDLIEVCGDVFEAFFGVYCYHPTYAEREGVNHRGRL